MRNDERPQVSLLLILLFALGSQLGAADFYVDTSNPNANDINPGTASQPWKTIAKANQTLSAGQRAYIKQGVYNTYISPVHSGTATNPITYAAYGSDSVTVSNAQWVVRLVGNSNIIVQGINGSNCDQFVSLVSASHNTIGYCNFYQQRSSSIWSASEMYMSSQYNWVHHCLFGNAGHLNTNTAWGTCFWIGDDSSTIDHSDYNLVENNTMFHGGHDVLTVSGSHNVIRDNYLHNENWSSGYGERCMMVMGHDEVGARNLFEGNRIAFSGYLPLGVGGGGSAGMALVSRTNIVRFNCFYGNSEPGLRLAVVATYYTSPQYNAIYNNTFYKNGVSTTSPQNTLNGLSLAYWGGTNYIVGNMIKNNLFYQNPGNNAPIVFDGVNQGDQILAANWLGTTNPLFMDITTPMNATNPSIPDFHLQTNSSCIDQGAFLTAITSATGSGTSFQVADPNCFMDGWGIVQGDQIQLQGSTQRATITNIDYVSKTIRVNTSLTWTQNQGISLAYAGAAPDVGACEFRIMDIRPAPPTNLRVVNDF